MKIEIHFHRPYMWESRNIDGGRVLVRGVIYNADEFWNSIEQQISQFSDESFSAFLNGIDGHYAVVAEVSGRVLLATDKIRSFPLFAAYHAEKGRMAGDQSRVMASAFSLDLSDSKIAAPVAMSGYAHGNATLYQNLYVLCAGQFVWVDEAFEPVSYYQYSPWKLNPRPREVLQSALCDRTLSILSKVIHSVEGRTIVVPLSAGLDSRVVVSGLAHLGYKKVKCFSYGTLGNFESKASKGIADSLGYEWRFVQLSQSLMADVYKSTQHDAYLEFADTCASVPVEHEFYSIAKLVEEGWIEKSDVLINGMSGDYISGSHIPAALDYETVPSQEERWTNLFNAVIKKHYSLWQDLETEENMEIIKRNILEELDEIGGFERDAKLDFALYEFLEWRNRQTKYVLTVQRVYDFFDLDWRLPLWDSEYLDFWASIEQQHKMGRNLFAESFKNANWAGIWQVLEYPRLFSPKWLFVLRGFTKLIVAPFGRLAWHQVDRRVFWYKMELLCKYAVVPYRKLLFDKRGFRNPVSWLTDTYLRNKGYNSDGVPSTRKIN